MVKIFFKMRQVSFYRGDKKCTHTIVWSIKGLHVFVPYSEESLSASHSSLIIGYIVYI